MCHSPNLGISRFPYAVTRTSVYSRPGITCCYTSQHVRVRTMQQVCHSPNLSISRYPYAVTRSSMYAYAPCSRCVIPQTSAYPGIHMPLHDPACTRTHHAAGVSFPKPQHIQVSICRYTSQHVRVRTMQQVMPIKWNLLRVRPRNTTEKRAANSISAPRIICKGTVTERCVSSKHDRKNLT